MIECACIQVRAPGRSGIGWITNRCPLHNPLTGTLVKRPVQFTGFLAVLKALGL